MNRGKAAFTVREGSSAVAAYGPDKRGRYTLSYYRFSGDKQQRENKTGEKAARARAREIAIALANGRAMVLELTNADREVYLHAQKLLEGTGVPLHEAVASFVSGRAKRSSTITVPEIAKQFLLAKETALANRELSQVHIDNLRDDLGKFVADFTCPISEVWTDQIQEWLNRRTMQRYSSRDGQRVKTTLPIGPRRRRNIRSRIVALFNYARRNGYLPLNEKTAAEWTAAPRIVKGKEPTFAPNDFDILINGAHHDSNQRKLVPTFAIGGFGRMRMSEIARLDWSAVHLFEKEKPGRYHKIAGEIDVSPEVAGKTGMARIIEIPPNLAKWLRLYARTSGPVLDPAITRIDNFVRRFAHKVGLKWQRNILRGSSTSYLYAFTDDLRYVASQHGTSERELKREYLERKTHEQAQAWLNIVPDSGNKILDLRWALRD